jgi:hypothetical protein
VLILILFKTEKKKEPRVLIVCDAVNFDDCKARV